MRARRAHLALAVLAVAGAAGPARALLGDPDGAIGVGGSLRTVGALIDGYDFEPFFGDGGVDALSQTLLRLTVVGRPMPRLAYELHAVQSVTWASSARRGDVTALPFVDLVPGDVRYRAFDMSLDWRRATEYAASFFVDRANVRLSFPAADVTVGRQAITLGKTFLWNPLDVFLPFDPSQFDQEYKPGVDALRVQVPLGMLSGLEVIGAVGRTVTVGSRLLGDTGPDVDATWVGTAVLGRAFTNVAGWDLSVQGGKVFAAEQVGAAVSGEVLGIEVRGEVVADFEDGSPPLIPALAPGDLARLAQGPLLIPRDLEPTPLLVEDSISAVVGVGRRFENTLLLEGEYFHNGAGDADDLDASLLRFASGGQLAMSEHLLGGFASYDVLPILIAEGLVIVSLDDGSVQIQPRLRWSVSDEIEVLAGAIVNRGSRPTLAPPGLVRLRSEFGTFPDVYYAEVKWYF